MQELTERQRRSLDVLIMDLDARFAGMFSHEMIEALVVDTYATRAAAASVTRWLVLSTERHCMERLERLAFDATGVTHVMPAGAPPATQAPIASSADRPPASRVRRRRSVRV